MAFNSRKFTGRYPIQMAHRRSARIDWFPIISVLSAIAAVAYFTIR